MPTAQASYYLGEAAVEAEQYEQAVAYFEQARQAGGKLQKQAEQQLVALKLQLQPESFIGASGSINSRGYLQISLVNHSPVAMNQIQLRVDTMANAFQIRSSRNLVVSQTIAAGNTVQLQLNIGATDDAQIPTFRLVVQAAKPLNTL